jgi:metal-responsive CopG/Arc/MetJ family transcriptional regulator
MKTAAAGRSRSEVYSAALREYVARHEPDDVTEAVKRVIEDLTKKAQPRGSPV